MDLAWIAIDTNKFYDVRPRRAPESAIECATDICSVVLELSIANYRPLNDEGVYPGFVQQQNF